MRQSQGNPTSDSQKKGTTGEDIEVALAVFMTPKTPLLNSQIKNKKASVTFKTKRVAPVEYY